MGLAALGLAIGPPLVRADWAFDLPHVGTVEIAHLPSIGASFALLLTSCFVLLCIAGMLSTLTISLMSTDMMTLQILVNGGGTPTEQKYANRIMGVIKKRHLLLATLFIANAAAMSALPIFLYFLLGPLPAVLLAVGTILIAGEILPQALGSRYGLFIGANLVWLVWVLIAILYPIAWPVSLILDWALAGSQSTFFRRAELAELVSLHVRDSQIKGSATRRERTLDAEERGENVAGASGEEEGLTRDEANIIKGVLDMKIKTVDKCMTPLEKVFMLSLADKLDEKTMDKILKSGFSRVPVYQGKKNNIIGMMIIKNLLKLSPKDAVLIEDLNLHRLPTVGADMPLYPMLDLFQRGQSHMALVVDPTDRVTVQGVITMEDVIEELIQEEIADETDNNRDIMDSIRAQGVKPRFNKNPLGEREARRLERAVSSIVLPFRKNPLDNVLKSGAASITAGNTVGVGTSYSNLLAGAGGSNSVASINDGGVGDQAAAVSASTPLLAGKPQKVSFLSTGKEQI
ncbi:uncharacterized protein ACA1_145880 [Acanthamoeba castellanii str. Neff]|uniref:CBS domain containing protein n=1 Tax=Acanthamoeba castellanii (strain ATCC 30010 / Neff) TaxID=1257118 RepID=L8GCY5_ACACF|nr:uncharacterized protein ACA1_145880 [Acanthamoeba castellanii str. Neff]ELR10932.1 hypothetical protein ACA1_145880 [Acanthamoeba castellanii str. Neff]